jgi:hypothetical protein
MKDKLSKVLYCFFDLSKTPIYIGSGQKQYCFSNYGRAETSKYSIIYKIKNEETQKYISSLKHPQFMFEIPFDDRCIHERLLIQWVKEFDDVKLINKNLPARMYSKSDQYLFKSILRIGNFNKDEYLLFINELLTKFNSISLNKINIESKLNYVTKNLS